MKLFGQELRFGVNDLRYELKDYVLVSLWGLLVMVAYTVFCYNFRGYRSNVCGISEKGTNFPA